MSFEKPELRTMVRAGDWLTSVEAALEVQKRATELHERVYAALSRHGPMTDDELERLAEFREYGPSTIRKRRSELYHAGHVVEDSTRKNRRGRTMVVWRVK